MAKCFLSSCSKNSVQKKKNDVMVQIHNPVFNIGYFAGGDEEYIYMNKVIVTGQNQDRTDRGESIIFSLINLQNFCWCEDEKSPLTCKHVSQISQWFILLFDSTALNVSCLGGWLGYGWSVKSPHPPLLTISCLFLSNSCPPLARSARPPSEAKLLCLDFTKEWE